MHEVWTYIIQKYSRVVNMDCDITLALLLFCEYNTKNWHAKNLGSLI